MRVIVDLLLPLQVLALTEGTRARGQRGRFLNGSAASDAAQLGVVCSAAPTGESSGWVMPEFSRPCQHQGPS